MRVAWHAKEVVRSIYDHLDPVLAVEFVARLGADRQLGRTITKRRAHIAPWHQAYVSNGPTEAVHN